MWVTTPYRMMRMMRKSPQGTHELPQPVGAGAFPSSAMLTPRFDTLRLAPLSPTPSNIRVTHSKLPNSSYSSKDGPGFIHAKA